MKKVDIYKLHNDGSQSVIATCRIVGEEAVCEGDRIFVNNLAHDGVRQRGADGSEKILFPKDGLAFLEILSDTFASGYLNASAVIDED